MKRLFYDFQCCCSICSTLSLHCMILQILLVRACKIISIMSHSTKLEKLDPQVFQEFFKITKMFAKGFFICCVSSNYTVRYYGSTGACYRRNDFFKCAVLLYYNFKLVLLLAFNTVDLTLKIHKPNSSSSDIIYYISYYNFLVVEVLC